MEVIVAHLKRLSPNALSNITFEELESGYPITGIRAGIV
jgi:hypothetical protein